MIDAIRQIGVMEATYDGWRKECGGMNAEQLKRLKEENERLRSAISDLTSNKLILKEASKGTSEAVQPSRMH